MQDSAEDSWKPFIKKARAFLSKTQKHALSGINPGGYYQAIWCRDASYILRDWYFSGSLQGVLQQIYIIWSHQIQSGREKIIYGRGSPEMRFLSEVASQRKEKEFEGSLPTTIYQAGFSEVYAQNPDIDSTALMISTTAWVLAQVFNEKHANIDDKTKDKGFQKQPIIASESSSDYVSSLLYKAGITDPAKLIDFAVPRMLKAIDYLITRDIDGDGLLEQNHNEDWMDTVLRAGKIVYSQACWTLALNDLVFLLSEIGQRTEANRLRALAQKTIQAVDEMLWSEENDCYIDIQESHHIGGPYRTLTQDVCLYLVAITENIGGKSNARREKSSGRKDHGAKLNRRQLQRALDTLGAIRTRVWKEKWPLVTEVELKSTGPWVLKPNQYHNHTFWPWTTGIEMLARSRFDAIGDCSILISTLTSGSEPYIHTYYEWINPITGKGSGAYPFRTGISAVRLATANILQKIEDRPLHTKKVAAHTA